MSAAFGKSRKPLLLYLDDMQWCDPDSFEWLNALLTSPAAARRPCARDGRGPRKQAANIRLPGLWRDCGNRGWYWKFRSSLWTRRRRPNWRASNPPNRSKAETWERSSGPLGAIRYLSWRVYGPDYRARGCMPSSQRAWRQLTAASYELAGVASVIGRPFSFELLEKATDWDEASVSQALDELWRRRIIESRGASEYDFTHDRLREVACAELSLVRQRYLHRRVARALAEVYAADIESWNGQIASHFEQAGMAEEAIEHYRRAAAYARAAVCGHGSGGPVQARPGAVPGIFRVGPEVETGAGFAGHAWSRAGGHGRLLRGRGGRDVRARAGSFETARRSAIFS